MVSLSFFVIVAKHPPVSLVIYVSKSSVVNSGDTVSFSKYTPVKTGYTFNGWATSNNATSGNTTGNSAPIT